MSNTTVSDNLNYFGVRNNPENDGFVPQLFTVPTGTYAPGSLGAGTAATGNLDAFTLSTQTVNAVRTDTSNSVPINALTGTTVREHSAHAIKEVDYELCITLDTSVTLVGGDILTDDELRIRPNPGRPVVNPCIKTVFNNYLSKHSFPETNDLSSNAKFLNVQLLDATNNLDYPVATNSVLLARLLHDGSLALLKRNVAAALGAANPSPLTVADINAVNDPAVLKIVVRGSYAHN